MQNVTMEGTSDIQEIQVLGDWAYLRNYIEMVVTPPNGAPVRRSGYTLTILRKESDGRWRLARDANLLGTLCRSACCHVAARGARPAVRADAADRPLTGARRERWIVPFPSRSTP